MNDFESCDTETIPVLTPPTMSFCDGEYSGLLSWTVESGGQHIPFTLSPTATPNVHYYFFASAATFEGGVTQYPDASGTLVCGTNSGTGRLTGTSSAAIAGRPNVPVVYEYTWRPAPGAVLTGGKGERQLASSADVSVRMMLGDGVFPGEPLIMRGTGRLTGKPLCVFQFLPGSVTANSTGGERIISVLANQPSCTWTASVNTPWITISGARTGTGSGTITLSLATNPGAARNATLTLGRQTMRIEQTAAAADKPELLSVVSNGSFVNGVSPSSWIAILGRNLSRTTRVWTGADFAGNRLPETLDGVEVTINGRRAYVYFVSPNQLNVLAPDDTARGDVILAVKNAIGSSEAFTVKSLVDVNPSLFTVAPGAPAATNAEGVLVGEPGLIAGAVTKPVAPRTVITLYGTGFGETNPPSPANVLVTGAPPTASPVRVMIGSVDAPVLFAGKVSPGLYQINVQVPDLPDGDHDLVASIRGSRTLQYLQIPVRR